MRHSKHVAVKKTSTKKKVIIIILILIIIVAISLFYIKSSQNSDNNTEEQIAENIVNEVPTNEVTEPVQETFEMVDTSDMPTTKGGYGVLGKIVIDKIGVENYILNKTTDDSLKQAVTWFWGPDPKNRTVNDIR